MPKKNNQNKFKSTGLNEDKRFNSTKINEQSSTLSFSFKFFDFDNNTFCFKHKNYNYFESLLFRLKSLSTMTSLELMSNKSKSIRCHPINWEGTTQKNGFTNLNEQFKSYTPYQFSLSTNEHGRVHGFFMGDIFHIIWFDPEHNLYS